MKIFRILFLILILSLNSCVSKKKVLYLQGDRVNSSNAVNYEPIIQNDDLLSIKILSSQTELSEPFNLSSMSTSIGNAQKGYLVYQNGEIEFPVLGKLKIAGYTKSELKQFFKDKLALYIANPIVDITILNYKISVLGEVRSPELLSLLVIELLYLML